MTRWRLIGLAGCVAVVIVTLVLVLGGGDKSHAVPEGGSSFGAGAPGTPRKAAGLMDALAPVLDQDGGAAPDAGGGSSGAGAGSGAKAGAAGAGAARRRRRPARRRPPRRATRCRPRRPGRRRGCSSSASAVRARRATSCGASRCTSGAAWSWSRGNGASPQQVATLVARIRGAALRVRHEPPLIAASQLGGELDAVPVGAPPQSAARDAAGARADALGVAKALHPLGIRMVLAPDADIGFAGGPWEGIAFSDDPREVAQMTAAAVSGFKDGEVAPAPGHFPGEGAASGDPALEAATVGLSLDELRARDLKPFAAVARHAPAIQLSAATYVAYDGVTPATLLPGVVTLLRKDLGFDGVIVSGDLAAASLAGGQPVADLAVQAVKAGVDLVWIPGDAGDQDAAWRAVVRALRTGEIPAARVADALRRVSVLRASYGVR